MKTAECLRWKRAQGRFHGVDDTDRGEGGQNKVGSSLFDAKMKCDSVSEWCCWCRPGSGAEGARTAAARGQTFKTAADAGHRLDTPLVGRGRLVSSVAV